MAMDAKVRETLQNYVRSGKIADWQPTLVRSEKTSQSAMLNVGIKEGSLLLQRDKNQYRLVFEKDDRAFPATPLGEYQLLGFRVQRQAKDGKQWFISTCGMKNQSIEISPKPTSQTIDSSIRVGVNAKRTGRLANIQLNIQSFAGSAITIYRDKHRVPADYEIRDGSGELIANGPMQYG